MYNKKDIEKTLLEFNYFIDEITLDNFIKNWKIDPIYEDEDGVEFFDNLSLVKLKKGISLKSQGYDNEKIIYYINQIVDDASAASKKEVAPVKEVKEVKEAVKTEFPVAEPKAEIQAVAKELPLEAKTPAELKNLTIDVSSQTLQMLADAVASKITTDIKTQIVEDTNLKYKNEELTKKVDELTEDNKKLAKRVEELEKTRKISFINFDYFAKFFSK